MSFWFKYEYNLQATNFSIILDKQLKLLTGL